VGDGATLDVVAVGLTAAVFFVGDITASHRGGSASASSSRASASPRRSP
jgi:hypothetical protein